jgi:transcriptional regulator with XRE-family HTH domain
MVKLKRQELFAEAARRNREQLGRLGGFVRRARVRRRMTQAELGARVRLARSTISAIERGLGGGHTLDTWQRLAGALDLPLVIDLGRDPIEEPADAGHLGIQELVLRFGRSTGRRGSFELQTRPTDPRRSTDVGLARRRKSASRPRGMLEHDWRPWCGRSIHESEGCGDGGACDRGRRRVDLRRGRLLGRASDATESCTRGALPGDLRGTLSRFVTRVGARPHDGQPTTERARPCLV